MKRRIKIFKNWNNKELEQQVDEFLKTVDMIDIQTHFVSNIINPNEENGECSINYMHIVYIIYN